MSEQTASTTADEAPASQDLKIWSCVHCRRRKLRCERRQPCTNCVRSKIDCHFPVTGRLPRRSRDPAATTNPPQKQTELLGRLRRLEAVVTELTGQMEDGAAASTTGAAQQDGAAIWQKHDNPTEDFGNLVTDENGGLRVDKGFWSIFCNEVDSIFQAVADVSEAPAEHTVTSDDNSNVAGSVRSHHQAFVMGNTLGASGGDDVDLSPLPSQMLFIWQVFCDNVDPFIKVLDTTEMIKPVRGAKGELQDVDHEKEALMFSVSLAAIVSLDEEEVELNFATTKPRLLARLRLGTERALASAKFMTARSLVVAQAFVIYIALLPQLGASQLMAPMTAILVRVALSMGLHRDPGMSTGESTGLSKDVELRRLLWWNICFLDAKVRHKDVPELSISPSSATTHEPANIDSRSPNDSKSTIFTLFLIRCELWRLSHDLREAGKGSLGTQQQLLYGARTRIQQTSFVGQDISNHSLQSFAYHLTQLLFSQVDYTIHMRQACNADQVAHALAAASTLMETTVALKTRTEWKSWRWQLQGHAPWPAMLFTLRILSRRPWTSQADQAWAALQRVVDTLPEDAQGLRVLQVVNRRIEDIRKSGEQRDSSGAGASEFQCFTSSEGPGPADQVSNQPRAPLANSENTSSFGVDGSAAISPFLQESWDLPATGDDATFQWEPLLETEDAMEWQVLNEGSDMSMFWDLPPF